MAKKQLDGMNFPWGRASGLLVACMTTIVGALQETSPSHLLYRVCVGSVLVCFVVNRFVRIVARTSPSRRATAAKRS